MTGSICWLPLLTAWKKVISRSYKCSANESGALILADSVIAVSVSLTLVLTYVCVWQSRHLLPF